MGFFDTIDSLSNGIDQISGLLDQAAKVKGAFEQFGSSAPGIYGPPLPPPGTWGGFPPPQPPVSPFPPPPIPESPPPITGEGIPGGPLEEEEPIPVRETGGAAILVTLAILLLAMSR